MAVVAETPWILDVDPLPYGEFRWLSDKFKMAAFINPTNDTAERRRRYFDKLDHMCEAAWDEDGRGPTAEECLTAVRSFLAIKVGHDGAFNEHVWRPDATEQASAEGWRKLHEAGAATIMKAYQAAVQSGKWPE